MYTVIITILTATSILFFLLFIFSLRSRRALARVLSLSLTTKIKKEMEKELEEELREKRRLNDEEISKKQASIDKLSEDYKKSQFEVAQNEIKKWLDQVGELKIKETNNFKNQHSTHLSEIAILEEEIVQLRINQEAVTEALRRKALEDDKYHLTLTDADRLEVEDLQAIATRYIRIRPIILKSVYDIYYAPEVKKLVSRIVGDQRVTGIYRITSRIDGRIYIGKSVDIRERWITHFKRAAGVETETTNLLYPAMRLHGLENFSFEIIERVVDETKLSEREKYWQTFYDAKTHGFSVK